VSRDTEVARADRTTASLAHASLARTPTATAYPNATTAYPNATTVYPNATTAYPNATANRPQIRVPRLPDLIHTELLFDGITFPDLRGIYSCPRAQPHACTGV
jgi:hypothetical protein